jgi:hypothetical protein
LAGASAAAQPVSHTEAAPLQLRAGNFKFQKFAFSALRLQLLRGELILKDRQLIELTIKY